MPDPGPRDQSPPPAPGVETGGGPAGRVDGYADIASYAALGDGRTIALVSADGQIDWLPVPRLDAAPVFAGLLDAGRGGVLTLRPRAASSTARRYVPGTNVLETVHRTDTGVVRVTDALVRGVAGQLPWTELARRVEGLEGEVDMAWSVVPGTTFGEGPLERFASASGPILRAGGVDLAVVGFGHGRTDPTDNTCGPSDGPRHFAGEFTATAGSRHLVCLVGVEDEPVHVPDPRIVDQGIDRTIAYWQTWSREFSWDGPWAHTVHRSALALKLLLSPSGAIAAAGTAGLPESSVAEKNYDYRFAWVRDLAYTVAEMLRFGLREEPHAAVSWLLKALKTHGNVLRVFFTLDGELSDGVRELDVEGWRGHGPVLVGNDAGDQLQLGCYADVLGLVTDYVKGGNLLDRPTTELIARFVDEACRRWPEPDSGMWELGEIRHYVSSKMGCWQALDCALDLVQRGELDAAESSVERWRHNKTLIEEWVDEHGWSEERGTYLMHAGGEALDASVLLHAISGFDRGERMSRTLDALHAELGAGPLLYRYSGMDEVEGTFTACSFWRASALACVGRHAEARALMDELVTHVNDVGLLAEMIEPSGGSFRGNMPQGLSHIALINAALTIAELDPDVTGGPAEPYRES